MAASAGRRWCSRSSTSLDETTGFDAGGDAASDVLDLSGPEPAGTVGEWSLLTGAARDEAFHVTRTHRAAPSDPVSTAALTDYAYRPMDYRVLYNDPSYVEWPRPNLQEAFSVDNLALVTIERGFGAGPAGFPVRALPDLHVFRGFAGSRGVYPLHAGLGAQQALDAEPRGTNIAAGAARWADQVLGEWKPDDVLAYVVALLNAPGYTAKFQGGLAVERPRIPLTDDPGLVSEAVGIGHEIMSAWLLRAPVLADIRWAPGGQTASAVGPAVWVAGTLHVAGRILEGVTLDTFEYEVSGYPVLARYCRDRADQATAAAVLAGIRTVASCIRRLVEAGPQLDDLLDRVLDSTLVRW